MTAYVVNELEALNVYMGVESLSARALLRREQFLYSLQSWIKELYLNLH